MQIKCQGMRRINDNIGIGKCNVVLGNFNSIDGEIKCLKCGYLNIIVYDAHTGFCDIRAIKQNKTIPKTRESLRAPVVLGNSARACEHQ